MHIRSIKSGQYNVHALKPQAKFDKHLRKKINAEFNFFNAAFESLLRMQNFLLKKQTSVKNIFVKKPNKNIRLSYFFLFHPPNTAIIIRHFYWNPYDHIVNCLLLTIGPKTGMRTDNSPAFCTSSGGTWLFLH